MHKHLAIEGGKSVPLSTSQYSSARDAFISSFRSNQDYTAATIAAIDSLKSSLGAGNGNVPGTPIPAGGIFSTLLGTVCCVGLILVVIVGVIFAEEPHPPERRLDGASLLPHTTIPPARPEFRGGNPVLATGTSAGEKHHSTPRETVPA
jgi:hypothetical protein